MVDTNDGVVSWYRRHGFQLLRETPRGLFLPMATIARMVELGGVI